MSETKNTSMNLAQLALGLAGFSSLSVAMLPKASGPDMEWRLESLLWTCFGAVLLALVHVLLVSHWESKKSTSEGANESNAARVCSLLMVAYAVVWLALVGPEILDGRADMDPVSWVVLTVGFGNCVMQLINGLWARGGSDLVFQIGLVWYVLVGIFTLMSSLGLDLLG